MSFSLTSSRLQEVEVIDSHTGGEPTRVVTTGGPDLGSGSLVDQKQRFASDFDGFRSVVVNEPRGSDVVVGALLCEPIHPESVAGVLFFNNVGYLNMCGHGTIGLAVTLAHMGRIQPGRHQIDTCVGTVGFELHDSHNVTIQNVPAYRYRKDVTVDVRGHGPVTGDIAWGGNWFFLINEHGQQLELSNVDKLTDFTCRVREALTREGITGENGGEIDHIELFAPTDSDDADSKNFVLCPGAAYDRSPCGTGTSAKLACLYEAGKLAEGETFRQASILGSVFQGQVRIDNGQIIPSITGSAYVSARSTLLIDPEDPFRFGF